MLFLKKYWSIFPLCFFGYLFIKNYIETYHEEFIFDFQILFFLAILWILFFLITIFKVFKYYRINKQYFELIPLLLGFVLVSVFFYLEYYYQKIDSSPIVLKANYDGDINGFTLEFRKDNTYKFFNYSVLGGKYFRGKYLLEDSIITLDKSNIDGVIKTNQLAIRNISEYYKGREYKFVQINKYHQRIEDEYFDFVINIDKRNN